MLYYIVNSCNLYNIKKKTRIDFISLFMYKNIVKITLHNIIPISFDYNYYLTSIKIST